MDDVEDEESVRIAKAEMLREDGIEVPDFDDPEYKSPNAGGCWICRKGSGWEDDDMDFDLEFDTFYHPECLERTGCESITDYEANYDAQV